MTHRIKTCAVLLAAGASRRFGAVKQLAEINGQTLISMALDNCRLPDIAEIRVVLGANAEKIAPRLPDDVIPLVAPEWLKGMGHSLGFAVRRLPDDVSHVLIVLVDQVAIKAEDIGKLLSASRQSPQQIVAAYYDGDSGAPAIFPREYFSQLCALEGDRGAKKVLKANALGLITVDMPSAAIDIDTPQDLQQI